MSRESFLVRLNSQVHFGKMSKLVLDLNRNFAPRAPSKITSFNRPGPKIIQQQQPPPPPPPPPTTTTTTSSQKKALGPSPDYPLFVASFYFHLNRLQGFVISVGRVTSQKIQGRRGMEIAWWQGTEWSEKMGDGIWKNRLYIGCKDMYAVCLQLYTHMYIFTHIYICIY